MANKKMAAAQACSPAPDDSWRRESDYRTLADADEIRRDPSRMKGVAQHHKKMSRTHTAIGRALKGRR